MDRRIIFVHGLGSGNKTWGKFRELIKSDKQLGATVHFMNYPTPLFGIKLFYLFQNSYQAIQDLAKGLKTAIDDLHKDADEIILVGHSMGGLIVRQYILDECISERIPKVKKIVLYAVPNQGSSFAKLATSISLYQNPQLMQLCGDSDFLDLLNSAWTKSKLYRDEEIDITVVVGGNDKIVDKRSAEGIFQHLEPKTIPHATHTTINKPQTKKDLAYVILKNAI